MKRSIIIPLWTFIILGLLLSPITETHDPALEWFKHFDKLVHFGLFVVTGLVGVWGAVFLRQFIFRMAFGLVFGLLLAFGTELTQHFLPSRNMSIQDLISNLAGLGVGLLAYVLFHRLYHNRASKK